MHRSKNHRTAMVLGALIFLSSVAVISYSDYQRRVSESEPCGPVNMAGETCYGSFVQEHDNGLVWMISKNASSVTSQLVSAKDARILIREEGATFISHDQPEHSVARQKYLAQTAPDFK